MIEWGRATVALFSKGQQRCLRGERSEQNIKDKRRERTSRAHQARNEIWTTRRRGRGTSVKVLVLGIRIKQDETADDVASEMDSWTKNCWTKMAIEVYLLVQLVTETVHVWSQRSLLPSMSLLKRYKQ